MVHSNYNHMFVFVCSNNLHVMELIRQFIHYGVWYLLVEEQRANKSEMTSKTCLCKPPAKSSVFAMYPQSSVH